MADDLEMSDPLDELDAGPPARPTKKQRKKPKGEAAGYDRRACRYPGCPDRNSGPRFKNFCRKHFAQMNPETHDEEPVAPEPEVVKAPKETKPMAAKTPTGPDGLPLDKLAALHEPLHARLARVRGIGPEEPIGLPGNGQSWTLTQVRNLEPWSRDTLGGGDFSARVVDERGQTVAWSWHNPGDEKKTSAQAATTNATGTTPPTSPASNPVPPAPFTSTTGQPANVIPIGGGMGITTLANGMMMAVPMPNATDTAGPPANGPLNARAAAQVWGGNADAAQQFLTMTQRLERAEADKERLAMSAQHDREMAELRNAIAQMKQVPTGPDPSMMAQIEELKRQLLAKDAESRHREEMAEMRRSTEQQITALTALIKENAAPKEDPFLRMMMESQKEQARANAEATKAQADAAKEVARLQSEAQRETARESAKTMEMLLAKTDQASIMTPFLQAFTGISQLTQGMTSTMLDVIKEVAEIKGEKGESVVERIVGPIVAKAGEVGQTLAEGYALSQQAKLRGAPAAVQAQPQPGRRPRVDIDTNDSQPSMPREGMPSVPGNGESATPVKENPVDLALRGYESAIPGEKEQYDAAQWGPALPEIMQLRKVIYGNKATPPLAAQALVQLVFSKSDFNLADQIPAFRFLQGDAESLATFVGLAIGACPEKQDATILMTFKRQTLDLFVKQLKDVWEQRQKAQADSDSGDEPDEEDDREYDDSNDPPTSDAPEQPEIPGNAA